MTKKFLCLVLVFGVFLNTPLLTTFAQAEKPTQTNQGLIVSPPIQEIETSPGKTYEIDYLIQNSTENSTITVDIGVETFEEGSIPGSANVVPFKPEKDISGWLKVPSTQEFKQGVNTKTSYQLTVPEDVQPGAYFFAITYQPRQSQTTEIGGKNNVVLKSRIATLLFVNIGGDNSKQPLIENFNAGPDWIDPLFDKINITYDVEVKGASFYRPVGNIFLNDENSEDISTLSSILSENLILPGGRRSYSECFGNNIFLQKCPQTTNISLPWFGKRNLDLRIDYTDGSGNPQSIVGKKEIVFFPYKTISIILIAGLVVIVGYQVYKKVRK